MIDKGVLWTSAEIRMGRRDLLTDDERRALFGVPEDHAALVRLYTLSRADLDTIRARRGDANCLGTAVQLALNSTYIADAANHLRALGEAVTDDLLPHISPVGWGHIAFSGDFLWDRAARSGGGRRPLNLSRQQLAA